LSVNNTNVLLYVDWTHKIPDSTFFFELAFGAVAPFESTLSFVVTILFLPIVRIVLLII
jgi:hypothetical protein